ncbi:MAG: carboxymuconolactone decarboxylase family protein [Caldisphaera sp.]|jgi:alkylhydroperoxidase/carboxymuconolactone decarboxylase family protein YurZ
MKNDSEQQLEKDYGEYPDWAIMLKKYSQEIYFNYLDLRQNILKDGILTKKEKNLILVGVNAAKRYMPSMMGHTKIAILYGATPSEIAEVVLIGIISRGIPSWIVGKNAVSYAEQITKVKVQLKGKKITEETEPSWLIELKAISKEIGDNYSKLRIKLLQDGHVSHLLKELILAGINLVDGYEEGVRLHIKNSVKLGATKQHLFELSTTLLLTAGIPVWFNILPFIKQQDF